MDHPPAISVVIASFSGPASLERCLQSLPSADPPPQVIVASNLPPETLAPLRDRFPNVQFLGRPGADVFALRTLGIESATGRAIAITEDHVTFTPRWLDAITQGLQHQSIVGGPIDNGLNRLWDWSLFACEYITFLPTTANPDSLHPAAVLSGVNVAYRRELLDDCRQVWRKSFHENEVHDALLAKGYSLHRLESAAVSSHLQMTLPGAMNHLFTGARHYGRYRKARQTGWRRQLLLPMTLLVPAVLLKRIFAAALSKRPARLGTLLLGLPLIACLITAWTCGEALGYLSSPLPPEDAP